MSFVNPAFSLVTAKAAMALKAVKAVHAVKAAPAIWRSVAIKGKMRSGRV